VNEGGLYEALKTAITLHILEKHGSRRYGNTNHTNKHPNNPDERLMLILGAP
jgi:hypothetical protein